MTCAALSTSAADLRWHSIVTGGEIAGAVVLPAATGSNQALATVVYLKNLSAPRVGQEPDETIIADLVKQGHLVLVLDYERHPRAIAPDMNADLLKLRRDIADAKNKTLLTNFKIDVNHLFILPEGFRVKRDVEFARDGARVLAMDIMYPSKPRQPVPVLMEITCDNVNRMGSASLLFCHDTLLEGGQVAGFAAAMIDHPVPPPYKGIDDPMPQNVHRLKAAVRTLRAKGAELGFNGQIGAIGFSRGGPMAALLAVIGDRSDLEPDGSNRQISSAIQAALIHGGRYDYLKLTPDDSMYKRFEKAWGPRDANAETWAMHGAAKYLSKDAAPMFLSTSDAESKEYRDQLGVFAKELQEAGVEHVYKEDADGRGHRVTTDPARLGEIYQFFRSKLEAKG